MLAAKTALSIRYDALGEDSSAELGAESRLKVETRMRQLEEKGVSLGCQDCKGNYIKAACVQIVVLQINSKCVSRVRL